MTTEQEMTSRLANHELVRHRHWRLLGALCSLLAVVIAPTGALLAPTAATAAVRQTLTTPATACFTTSAYSVGTTLGVAAGDFNGDSRSDVAATSMSLNQMAVLINNGDGTFQPAVTYATGVDPRDIRSADLNGDDHRDLVTANASDSVSVFINDGLGGFGPAMTYGTSSGTQPLYVAFGDFNGDGVRDIVTSDYGPSYSLGHVSILLGKGDGTFRNAQNYTAGIDPVTVAPGDFTNDGVLDLVVGNNNFPQGYSLLVGNGDGTFRQYVHHDYNGNPRLAAADFNLDGNLDIAYGSWQEGAGVAFGHGDGTFGTPTFVPVGSAAGVSVLVAVDLNHDGRPDEAGTASGTNELGVLAGKGDGHLKKPVLITVGDTPRDLAVGNMNGDHRPDFATADYTSGTVTIVLSC